LHFDAYAASQVTQVPQTIPHPTQDKEMNLARAEKNGVRQCTATAIFAEILIGTIKCIITT